MSDESFTAGRENLTCLSFRQLFRDAQELDSFSACLQNRRWSLSASAASTLEVSKQCSNQVFSTSDGTLVNLVTKDIDDAFIARSEKDKYVFDQRP